jgi:hypothetical protein
VLRDADLRLLKIERKKLRVANAEDATRFSVS